MAAVSALESRKPIPAFVVVFFDDEQKYITDSHESADQRFCGISLDKSIVEGKKFVTAVQIAGTLRVRTPDVISFSKLNVALQLSTDMYITAEPNTGLELKPDPVNANAVARILSVFYMGNGIAELELAILRHCEPAVRPPVPRIASLMPKAQLLVNNTFKKLAQALDTICSEDELYDSLMEVQTSSVLTADQQRCRKEWHAFKTGDIVLPFSFNTFKVNSLEDKQYYVDEANRTVEVDLVHNISDIGDKIFTIDENDPPQRTYPMYKTANWGGGPAPQRVELNSGNRNLIVALLKNPAASPDDIASVAAQINNTG